MYMSDNVTANEERGKKALGRSSRWGTSFYSI